MARPNISVNQSPQYGDKTVIDNLKKQTKPLPDSGAEAIAPQAGRPATGSAPAQPTDDRVSQHMSGMEEVAMALRTFQYWQRVNQLAPSDFNQMYLRDAQENYIKVAKEFRKATPFVES